MKTRPIPRDLSSVADTELLELENLYAVWIRSYQHFKPACMPGEETWEERVALYEGWIEQVRSELRNRNPILFQHWL